MLTADSHPAADFFVEIVGSIKFYVDRLRNRHGDSRPRVTVTDSTTGKPKAKANFEEAFGFSGYQTTEVADPDRMRIRGSYDENIRLAPYTYGGTGRRRATSSDDVATTASENPEGYSTTDLRKQATPV